MEGLQNSVAPTTAQHIAKHIASSIAAPRPSWGGRRQDLQQLLQLSARTAGRQSLKARHLKVRTAELGSPGGVPGMWHGSHHTPVMLAIPAPWILWVGSSLRGIYYFIFMGLIWFDTWKPWETPLKMQWLIIIISYPYWNGKNMRNVNCFHNHMGWEKKRTLFAQLFWDA